MASKARLFYPDKLKTGTISRLSEKQSHYTKNVMRLKAETKFHFLIHKMGSGM